MDSYLTTIEALTEKVRFAHSREDWPGLLLANQEICSLLEAIEDTPLSTKGVLALRGLRHSYSEVLKAVELRRIQEPRRKQA